MRARSRRPGVARLIPAVSLVAAVALGSCAGASLAAPSHVTAQQAKSGVAGTWSGRYRGAASGTFTLRWTQSGSKLRGTIKLSNPRGTYPITGTVRGATISFGAVGVGATYSGTVSGRSMSGRWKSASLRGTWSARKIS